ncbi:MAG: (Fe-S)-binding protein [Proteobacteria bacterium]|nr:(Fe-S)-binding protein [Pseudomonadota bacterium]
MGPLGVSALLLAAFAAFTWLSARKLAIVAALQPEVRWDHPWRRLRTVVTNGLLQQRMIRREWKPGVMHTIIFLGFASLLVRKLQLVVIGFDAEFALTGPLGDAFTVGKDLVEVGVLLAVGYAFYRRLLLKPARLEPNREGLLVLGLITVIMLTDLAFDAFRFAQLADSVPAIAHERGHAPVGGWLASLVAHWPARTLAIAAAASYWTQMIMVCAFLVLMPLGEHFHIVTALPALFFRRGRPANAVPTVDLSPLLDDAADASELKVGARSVADLVWKDALDAFTCTECGRCKDACPAFQTGKPLSMKSVNDSLKHHLLEQRKTILAGGAAQADLPALVGEVISDDTLWSCTTCGYCEAACPIELELLPKFYRLRQHRVMMDGEFPTELKNVFDAYEVQSNPWGLPADTRGDWARGLDLPLIRNAADMAGVEWLFYVGSAESFDQNGQRIARAFVEILREAGVRFGILGAQEPTTGECVRRAGNEMLFQQLATTLVESFNGLGTTRIVTCDPHAFNSLRNEYPAFGGHWEVLHHTQLIARLLAERRIEVQPTHERVLLHDPCYLGRHNGEFDAPRAVLGRVTRDALLEFPLHREKSMCCGAGGARMWMEEHIGTRINVTRVEQGLPQRPNVIATACPYCSVMLGDGLKSKNLNETIATRDVAELVAAAMVRTRVNG